ncbi:MAG: acyl-CoA dehydrogenase family protein [Bacillota bacterium]
MFREEHLAFRKVVRNWLAREICPEADKWEKAGDLPAAVFQKFGDMGLLGLKFPEEYAGQGVDLFSAAVFLEEMGYAALGSLVASVGAHSEVALPPVYKYGNEEQKQRYLVPGIKGEKIGALAVTEPDAGSNVAGIQTVARRTEDGYVLNGSKIFISNGGVADFVVVAAKTDPAAGHRGISLFIVEKGTPGFSAGRKLDKAGMLAANTAELIFEECRVPAESILGTENRGFYQLMDGFQWERMYLALGSVGIARAALEEAVNYTGRRIQFGQPICKFQALRHRLVDMAARVEMARHLVYNALWLISNGKNCLKEVSMAKYAAAEAAYDVAGSALQMHGGYGYMKEYPIERIWRDSRVLAIVGGTVEIMKEIVAGEMGL